MTLSFCQHLEDGAVNWLYPTDILTILTTKQMLSFETISTFLDWALDQEEDQDNNKKKKSSLILVNV